MTDGNDFQAIIASAHEAALTQVLDRGDDLVALDRHREIVDLEHLGDRPRRVHQLVYLDLPDSMAAYVNLHKGSSTDLYAKETDNEVVAVINGQRPDEPAWSDHLAVLKLAHSLPWSRWTGRAGSMMSQEEFARFLEANLVDIVEPDGATMLELAQSLEATNSVAFRSAIRLASGERQFRYEENITASAGRAGDLVVPEVFTLGMPVYEGGAAYSVKAFLRYQLREDALKLGYVLDRPEDVHRDAFHTIVGDLEAATGVAPFYGRFAGTGTPAPEAI